MPNLNLDYIDYEPINESCQEIIYEDEVICTLYGFRESNCKLILYHCLGVLCLGIPYLVFQFYPKFKTIKFRRSSLQDATVVFIKDNNEDYLFENVQCDKIRVPKMGSVLLRYFYFQRTKFVWIDEQNRFSTLDALIPPDTLDDYLNNLNGLSDVEYIDLLKIYGPNKIEIKIKSYLTLFVEEIFNPFYLFQIFSIILWCVDDYFIYAVCVFFLTAASTWTSLRQTRRDSETLHDLVESSKCHNVTVLRQNGNNGENQSVCINPIELVPGDLIILPLCDFNMPCDAVLLTGQCIVNESVLTGESVPITKTSLQPGNEIYSSNFHKRHTLYSGTYIIQTRYYDNKEVLARVVRTGFDTTKGALVKSILYQQPIDPQFYRDTFKFVVVLFILAACGMGYCLWMYIHRKANIKDMIIRTLDIITIVVPPALPAAMAVGTLQSQNRLKMKKLFCRSPPRINTCGRIKLACFDKTGTLTDDGLIMKFVLPCNNSLFNNKIHNYLNLDIHSKLIQAMASCHSLTIIDGELKGDPLDINMFMFTKWELREPGQETSRYDMLATTFVTPGQNVVSDFELPYQIGIIRQFPFSSRMQCMTVICRELGKPYMTAFTKGAPEKLLDMCLPETLPYDFSSCLSEYTANGFRVIAIAYKDLPKKFHLTEALKTKRDVLECNLTFLGFLVMQNPLKPETAPVISLLHRANIRTVMITGDNILTAISVARDCGMVKPNDKIYILHAESNNDNLTQIPNIILKEANALQTFDNLPIDVSINDYHFAMDGKTWNKLRLFYQDKLPYYLVKCTIFARFQPDQKTQVIKGFQKLDYIVSMVGDGANDCGALKAAHVGVSLSESETSVAAPFTSSIQDISCMIHLILEGRCALVTSFAIFKYMALYSLIQFITILILYKNHSILGDYQFLFIDLIITSALAITLGNQGPSTELGPEKPLSSLVSIKNIIPLFLQIITCAIIQIGALFYLFKQKWFEPIEPNHKEEIILSWENTVLFTVSCYQYVILATVYSKGRPHRRMLITNYWFLIIAFSLLIFITWLMIYPCKKMAEIFEIMYLPHRAHDQYIFRCSLLIFPIVHLLLSVFIEAGLADRWWFKKFIQLVKCKRKPKNGYKVLLLQSRTEIRV